MSSPRMRNARVLVPTLGTILVMIGLVSYAPTLYRLFCAATGYGGTVRRADAEQTAPVSDQTVTVFFDANVGPDLAWDFQPAQRKVVTHIGEPTTIYYTARNDSDETVVAHATYNVTPYEVAPYFFKIQCFCFTDEKLAPHQSARMPVQFYVDEQFLKDHTTSDLREITLSYTFFRQDGLSSEDLAAARDLKSGSEATDSRLEHADVTAFDNDAPRRQ